MTPAVLLIVVGVLLILAGVVGVLIYPKVVAVGERWQRWVVASLGLVLLMPGLVLAFRTDGGPDPANGTTSTSALGGTTPAAPTTTTEGRPVPRPPRGEILIPQAGTVPREMTASGTARDVPEGHSVFLLVEIGRHYPQGPLLQLLPDGTWSRVVRFGQPGDSNQRFNLHLVEAGPAGTATLNTYLRRAQETGEFPGIAANAIPSDVKFLDSVAVTRQ